MTRRRGSPADWRLEAACGPGSGADPAWFFPPGDGDNIDRGDGKKIDRRAAVFCDVCPVLEPCREHGVANEDHGSWGGWSQAQIRREKRRRTDATNRARRRGAA